MAEYLVTGGTSFIASHVIKSLLEFGHYVRTTVRDSGDEEKVGFLWELKGAKERLKIFEADLTVEGSFDDAVNGVDGVSHIASRVSVGLDNNNLEKFDPNISGTMNVMNSCAKSINTVKRYGTVLTLHKSLHLTNRIGLILNAANASKFGMVIKRL
ncbi:unnamed protein product [Arabidopsis halleri]